MYDKNKAKISFLFTDLLGACSGNDNGSSSEIVVIERNCIECLWTDQSYRMIITEEGGIAGKPQAVIVDITPDTLENEVVWNSIKDMSVTHESSVVNQTDIFIYHVYITETSGIETEFYDN